MKCEILWIIDSTCYDRSETLNRYSLSVQYSLVYRDGQVIGQYDSFTGQVLVSCQNLCGLHMSCLYNKIHDLLAELNFRLFKAFLCLKLFLFV